MLQEIKDLLLGDLPHLVIEKRQVQNVSHYDFYQDSLEFLGGLVGKGLIRPRCGAFIGGYAFFPLKKVGEPFKDIDHPLVQACGRWGSDLRVYDVSAVPARSFFKSTALLEEHMLSAMAYGMTSVEDGTDFLAVVDMSAGYELACIALLKALGIFMLDKDIQELFKDEAAYILLEHRLEDCKENNINDGFDILKEFGGYEIASMMGAVIASRFARIPVFLDGIVGITVIAILERIRKGFTEHCFLVISEKERRIAKEAGCHHIITCDDDVTQAYPHGARVIHLVDQLQLR